MNYEKKLKSRIMLYAVLAVVAIIALISGIVAESSQDIESFAAGYLTGSGGGLFGASVVLIIKNLMALRNKDKQKSMMIEETDERNLLLGYKAGYYSMLTTTLILYIASIYYVFNDSTMIMRLASIIGLMMVVYVALYYSFKRFK
ncbi:hypothetical protein [Vallitalea okinawensis]|uniref:hypothetical protein n=1 Tax=Vallitalea okinawensis TaxID=2078660 RepID=UPI000CFCDD2B|nr:hypothetical protein [Vallitalea okinawensis]